MNDSERKLPIPEESILSLLRDIEYRRVTLTAIDDPSEVYAGDVRYEASNGWKLTVFNDCNCWDYLDKVESPDGRVVDFDSMWDLSPALSSYTPPDDVVVSVYGIKW